MLVVSLLATSIINISLLMFMMLVIASVIISVLIINLFYYQHCVFKFTCLHNVDSNFGYYWHKKESTHVDSFFYIYFFKTCLEDIVDFKRFTVKWFIAFINNINNAQGKKFYQ